MNSDKIDVHHHVYPPVFAEAVERSGGDTFGWYLPPWSVEADQSICKTIGVGTAILSYTAPGPEDESEPAAQKKLARACNEYNAKLRDAYANAYEFFAAVPSLLNAEDAIDEMRYAFNTLHADGVCLMTRYGNDNYYLGYEDFAALWDFLNSRQAVVFVHPTHPVVTSLVSKTLPEPAFDYPHETGRAAIDLILSDTLCLHASKCKIILSHAGGTLPYLIDRPAGLLPNVPASASFGTKKSTSDIIAEARWFYYDTALASSPMVLKALGALLGEKGMDHILFGSDFPNAPTNGIAYFTKQLEGQSEVAVSRLRENALKLFPRLKQ